MKDRITALCAKKGVSAKVAEDEMGIAKGYISKLTSSNPNLRTVEKMAEYFGVSPQYIAGWDKPSVNDAEFIADVMFDKELMSFIKKIADMDSDKKKIIFDYIDFINSK